MPNTTCIHEQCRERVAQRTAIRQMADDVGAIAARKRVKESKAIKAMLKPIEQRCVTQALARLPDNASFALKQQVIREAME